MTSNINFEAHQLKKRSKLKDLSGDKCGEIFVTDEGAFSWFCTLCTDNFIKIEEFTNHVTHEHLLNNVNAMQIADESNILNNKKNKQIDKIKISYLDPLKLEETTITKKDDKLDYKMINWIIKLEESDEKIVSDEKVLSDEKVVSDEKVEKDKDSIKSDFEVSSDSDGENIDQIFKTPYNCEICKRSYKIERALILHRKKHDNAMLCCKHCGILFMSKKQSKNHDRIECAKREEIRIEKSIKKKPDLQCKYCTKIFKQKSFLKSHELRHENPQHKCSFCTKSFMAKYLLNDHLRQHTGERPYKCEYCPSAFANGTNLNRHVLIHIGERTCYCTFGCGKAFFKERERVGHERSHTGEKPFVCELCGRHFAFQHQMSLHKKRFHMDKKNWKHKCNQCGRAFIAPNSLREHMVVHTGEKPYTCDQCSGRFSKLSGLREHRKLHSGIKKHICTICDKAFAQTAGLYGHMKSHGVIKENNEVN